MARTRNRQGQLARRPDRTAPVSPGMPVPGWRVRPCYGGFYWETFWDGVKANGGVAGDEIEARAMARHHLHDNRWRMRP